MSFQRGDERLRRVVPDLDGAVVGRGNDVGLVSARVVIDVVDALAFVGFEGKVGAAAATDAPYLDGSI